MESIKKCTEDIAKRSYSFRIDYDNMSRKEQQKFRTEIQTSLGYKTNRSFYQKCNGTTVLSAIERDILENILRKHEVKWDYEHKSNEQGVSSR